MRFCDLHTHSIFSDGTSTPEELLTAATAAGLSAIALTDHNTIDGLPHFAAAAEGKNIDTVLGSEFSVNYEGKELHMLGLFISPEYFSQISALMSDMLKIKEKSNIDLVEALGRAGMPMDYDKIRSATPRGSVNRAHIASAMVQKGYVSSVAEAFATYLSPEAGYFKEPERIDVWKMIDVIHSIGAVSVLAHPFLKLNATELVTFLPKAKQAGLDGMECIYSLNNDATTRISIERAERFGLLKSGGSDFHGQRKPDIKIGVGKGDLQVPHDWYLRLKEKAKATSVMLQAEHSR